jgi:alkyl hydroperoxide reductase subunit AhpC
MLRLIDSLQITDKHRVATPVDWVPGQDVIVSCEIKDEEARKLFPGFRTVKPYLRYTSI